MSLEKSCRNDVLYEKFVRLTLMKLTLNLIRNCIFQIFGSLFALGYPPIQILLVGAYIVSSYFGIVEKQFGKLEQVLF